MGAIGSRRSLSFIIYHCPACFADRIGEMKRGPWRAWPDDRPDDGRYVECTGCGSQVHPCNVTGSVTATAFSTRIFCGARSLIASVLVAGADGNEPPAEGLIEIAIDAVETVAPLRYSRGQLMEDLADPTLATRLRGDLILLAEQLRPQGVEALLRQARRVAMASGGPTDEQRTVIEDAERYLGYDLRRSAAPPPLDR
jgi:hypothetical protein